MECAFDRLLDSLQVDFFSSEQLLTCLVDGFPCAPTGSSISLSDDVLFTFWNGDNGYYSILKGLGFLSSLNDLPFDVSQVLYKLARSSCTPIQDHGEFLIAATRLVLSSHSVENWIGIFRALNVIPGETTVIIAISSVMHRLRSPSSTKQSSLFEYLAYLISLLPASSTDSTVEKGRQLIMKRIESQQAVCSKMSIEEHETLLRTVGYALYALDDRVVRRRYYDFVLSTFTYADADVNIQSQSNFKAANLRVVLCALNCLLKQVDDFINCRMLVDSSRLSSFLTNLLAVCQLSNGEGRTQRDMVAAQCRDAAHRLLGRIVDAEARQLDGSLSGADYNISKLIASVCCSTLRSRCSTTRESIGSAIIGLSCLPSSILSDSSTLTIDAKEVFRIISAPNSCSYLVEGLRLYAHVCTRGSTDDGTVSVLSHSKALNDVEIVLDTLIPSCIRNQLGNASSLGLTMATLFQSARFQKSQSFGSFLCCITKENIQYVQSLWSSLWSAIPVAHRSLFQMNTTKLLMRFFAKINRPSDSVSYRTNLVTFLRSLVAIEADSDIADPGSFLTDVVPVLLDHLLRLLNSSSLSSEELNLLDELSKFAAVCAQRGQNYYFVVKLLDALARRIILANGFEVDECKRLFYLLIDKMDARNLTNRYLRSALFESLCRRATVTDMRSLLRLLTVVEWKTEDSEKYVVALREFLSHEQQHPNHRSASSAEDWIVARHSVLRVLDEKMKPSRRKDEAACLPQIALCLHGQIVYLARDCLTDAPTRLHCVKSLLHWIVRSTRRNSQEELIPKSLKELSTILLPLTDELKNIIIDFIMEIMRNRKFPDTSVVQIIRSFIHLCTSGNLPPSLWRAISQLVVVQPGRVAEPPAYRNRMLVVTRALFADLRCWSSQDPISFLTAVNYMSVDDGTNIVWPVSDIDITDCYQRLSDSVDWRTLVPNTVLAMLIDQSETSCEDPMECADSGEYIDVKQCIWSSLTLSDWKENITKIIYRIGIDESVGWCRRMLLSLPNQLRLSQSTIGRLSSLLLERWTDIWGDTPPGTQLSVIECLIDIGMRVSSLSPKANTALLGVSPEAPGFLVKQFQSDGLESNLCLSCLSRLLSSDSSLQSLQLAVSYCLTVAASRSTCDPVTGKLLIQLAVHSVVDAVLAALPIIDFLISSNDVKPIRSILLWFKRSTPTHQYMFLTHSWNRYMEMDDKGGRFSSFVQSLLIPCLSLLCNHNQRELTTFLVLVMKWCLKQCAVKDVNYERDMAWMTVLDLLLSRCVARRMVACLVQISDSALDAVSSCAGCETMESTEQHGCWSGVKATLVSRLRVLSKRGGDYRLSLAASSLLLSIWRLWPSKPRLLDSALPSAERWISLLPADPWTIGIYSQSFQADVTITSVETDLVVDDEDDDNSVVRKRTVYDDFVDRVVALVKSCLKRTNDISDDPKWIESICTVLESTNISAILLLLSVITRFEWHDNYPRCRLIRIIWRAACRLSMEHTSRSRDGMVTSVPALTLCVAEMLSKWTEKCQRAVDEYLRVEIVSFLEERAVNENTHNKKQVAECLQKLRLAWLFHQSEDLRSVSREMEKERRSTDPLIQCALDTLQRIEDGHSDLNATLGDTCATVGVDSQTQAMFLLRSEEEEEEDDDDLLDGNYEEDGEEAEQSNLIRPCSSWRIRNTESVELARSRLLGGDMILALSIIGRFHESQLKDTAIATRIDDLMSDQSQLSSLLWLYRRLNLPTPIVPTLSQQLIRRQELANQEQSMIDEMSQLDLGTSCLDDCEGGISAIRLWRRAIQGQFQLSELPILPPPFSILLLIGSSRWEDALYAAEDWAGLLCSIHSDDVECLSNYAAGWSQCLSIYRLIMDHLTAVSQKSLSTTGYSSLLMDICRLASLDTSLDIQM